MDRLNQCKVKDSFQFSTYRKSDLITINYQLTIDKKPFSVDNQTVYDQQVV